MDNRGSDLHSSGPSTWRRLRKTCGKRALSNACTQAVETGQGYFKGLLRADLECCNHGCFIFSIVRSCCTFAVLLSYWLVWFAGLAVPDGPRSWQCQTAATTCKNVSKTQVTNAFHLSGQKDLPVVNLLKTSTFQCFCCLTAFVSGERAVLYESQALLTTIFQQSRAHLVAEPAGSA